VADGVDPGEKSLVPAQADAAAAATASQ